MTAKNGKMMELLPMLSMQRQLGLKANDELSELVEHLSSLGESSVFSCFLITGTPRTRAAQCGGAACVQH